MPPDPQDAIQAALDPDIWTFTTILNIAINTSHSRTVRQGLNLLERSGLPPNRVTYLSFIRHYTRTGRVWAIRSTLAQMASRGLELGIDGLNACMWAFGRHNFPEIAHAIYTVLRSNVVADTTEDIDALKQLLASEHIIVPPGLPPDHITYVTMIQILAYRGDLQRSLATFTDYVSTIVAPLEADNPNVGVFYLPAFRSLFLGFIRHAQDHRQVPAFSISYGGRHSVHRQLTPHLAFANAGSSDESEWTLEVLDAIFSNFIRLPPGAEPTENMLFRILSAYSKTTGDDMDKLREVCGRLEERFGGDWVSNRLVAMRAWIYGDREAYEVLKEEPWSSADDEDVIASTD